MQQIAATKFCHSDSDCHLSHEAVCGIVCLGLNGGKHLFLYLYKNTTSHNSFSILIDGTPYFVGIVDDMELLFVRESSVGSLLSIFYPLTRWGIFDQI